jgi:DNA polymerase-3 subunit delta'
VSFENIKGQTQVIDIFRNACRNDRLAGAYILAGPEGVGKLLFARELAKYLLCRNRNEDSCGTCSSCIKVDHGTHPDLFELETKETDKEIKIAYVRALQEQLYLKPFEAEVKVFLVNDAHKMNEESANCFLKSFEEPPEDSIIILITHNLSKILPTIRSRAVTVNFRPLDKETMGKILLDRGLGGDDARFLAALSAGSLSKAQSLMQGDFEPKRRWLTERLFAVGGADHFDLAEELLGLCKTAGGAKQQLRDGLLQMLDMMTLFCRLLLRGCIAKGGDAPAVRRLIPAGAKIFSQRQLEKIIMELERTSGHVSLNANMSIALENMFYRIGKIQGG